MKKENNILIAFILNLFFAVFEFIGGIISGSVAITSDALHDLGDAASVGISFILEKKSNRPPNEKYTYGYGGYSVIGGLINSLILLIGSAFVIYGAVQRIISPVRINYDGMIAFAVIGVTVNFAAAFFTREGASLNQKAVNLHMLEDVLGWVAVLIGATVMKFTDLYILDPLMSIGVAFFISVSAVKNLAEVFSVILAKAPKGIDVVEIRDHIMGLDGVLDVHHIHIWSIDGITNYATMHVVTDRNAHSVKSAVREELLEHGIAHATLELEFSGEECQERECRRTSLKHIRHHH